MKTVAVIAILLTAFAGCTATALRRYTVNQAATVSDLRYQEVIDSLALLADNPGNMVSFAIVDNGTTTVGDTFQGQASTLWDHAVHGFSKETLTAVAKRNPDMQWTLSPVVSKPQLAGIRYACLWQLYGPPPVDSDYMILLRAPMYGEYTGYHLGVADQLRRIPPGWLHVGCKKDVPRCACFSAHSHDKYVWVTPEGMTSLSEFSLVILDIATLDPTSLALAQPYLSVETTESPPAGGLQVSTSTQLVSARQSYVYVDGKVVPGDISVQKPITVSSTAPTFEWSKTETPPQTPPVPSNVPHLQMQFR